MTSSNYPVNHDALQDAIRRVVDAAHDLALSDQRRCKVAEREEDRAVRALWRTITGRWPSAREQFALNASVQHGWKRNADTVVPVEGGAS